MKPAHRSSAPLPRVTRSGRAGRSLTAERLAARRQAARGLLGGFAVVALVGATLSFTAGSGQAAGLAEAKKPGFAGYNVTGSASPLKIEIYEPTIPIPATPQAELSVGYTAVTADTASSRARSSYLWPGAAVGEGFKTIVDQLAAQLMLPPGTLDPVAADGYPVQVNAIYPSGPEEQAAEPGPGMIQRASAADDVARAENGTSTDSQVDGTDDAATDEPTDDPTSEGPLPGLPTGLPLLGPVTAPLTDALAGVTGAGGTKADGAPTAAPALPEPLAALVDVGGFTSVSRTENDSDAFVQSRSIASDVTILGGVAKITSVKTVANASSDGTKGKGNGVAEYGNLVVAGQTFKITDQGLEATGTQVQIPGLPAQGKALLKELGIKITVGEPVYTVDKDAASTFMPGIIIDFDLGALKSRSGALTDAAATVIGMLPDDQGVPIKSGLQAAIYAAPRMVFYVGQSFAGVDTSQEIVLPTTDPTTEPTEEPTEATTSAAAVPGPDSGVDVPPAAAIDPPPADPVDPGTGTATTEAVSPVSSEPVPGLPPLLSFPGLLLYGGLLGAGVAGFFTRRLGLLALGTAGSCPHGLVSGLPDLRKVT